jgi:PAS domain S-box-containing protein
MTDYHSLLKRQLKRHLGKEKADDPAWSALVEAVDAAYRQFDADRHMLERSLDLSSQELVGANRDLRAILQRLPDVFFRINSEGVILDGHIGEAGKAFRSPDELVGTHIQDLPLKEYRAAFDSAVREVAGGTKRTMVEFILPSNGTPIHCEASLLPLPDRQVIVFIQDITPRRRAEEAVRASERKHRELADALPETVFEMDAEGNILYFNASGLADFGYTSADLAHGLNARDLVPPDAGALVQQEIEKAMRGEKYQQEWVVRRKNGTLFTIMASAVPVMQEGRAVGLRGIAINTTEQKSAEMERARLHTAIEQAAESVMITDEKGAILYVNPAFERITGYLREDVVGRNPRILRSGRQNHGYYKHMWDLLAHGHVWTGRLIDQRKDGSLFEWDSTISPVRNSEGLIVNYVAVSRDVTREVQLEEQLRQSHKMEAIGRLAGGVAHDFNNLLTVIMGNIDLVLPDMPASDPSRQPIVEVREAAQRAASLTGQLLAFGRRQVLHPKVIDLNGVVDHMEKMFRRVLGENIDLQIRLAQDIGKVRADPTQMEQVLLNLALNARDAMPGGGMLSITTSNAAVDESHALRLGDVGPGTYVGLEISDTGTGMDAETRQHLFEPFFTTKERGKGTGLGLATVYGIVKQSGGHISVYSEPGNGSTFRVYLPRVEHPSDAAELEPPKVGLLSGHETILVVEDEDLVRKLTCAMLQKQGYKIIAARHGDEALRLAATYDGPIDLVLSDVVMPGIKVEEMAERILDQRPGLKLLYMSGHPESTIIHLGVFSGSMPLLKKPFTAAELGKKVRESLDGL